ncbi:MAG: hydrogenase expression/formation protein HypE [Firmicutes bacterium]|nr:hydrogenase expression/formation protein HypE [Bacillota bacterium]
MDVITLAHGAGGQLTKELIEGLFYKYFNNEILLQGNDSAVLPALKGKIVTSTDSFVIKPIFFRGGDIGKLSVCGTVNDLVMSGASPLYITVAFIIEEGFEINHLERIVESIAETASAAGIMVVTGDTKVVEKGFCDSIYINTTGIGVLERDIYLSGDRAEIGDEVIINGNIGEHEASILIQRGELGLSGELKSDCALLDRLIIDILDNCQQVKVLRDPTRGGIATTLNEIAQQSGLSIRLVEDSLPIGNQVRSLCRITGFDPLYLANEGKVVVFVNPAESRLVLEIMQQSSLGKDARIIGEVIEDNKQRVYLKTNISGTRIINSLTGELLPRIC